MKKLLTCLALSFVAASSYAATPLWLRDVQISPDGTEIAFCYKGDIYKVPANGGTATQLTTQTSYECSPVWSPDSKQIAFASDRNGNFDLFVMPAGGGAARRLTTHSASEIPSAFTTDGNYILFSASIQDPAGSALFPTSAMTELYKVPVNGGRTEQVLGTPAEMVCFDPSGKTFLYQDRKGFEDEWRKHHTSSITRDVWLYNSENGKHTNLTNHAGEDRNPVFAPDGQTVYFLSERNGSTFNVYSFPLDAPQSLKAVTGFKTHPVRFLSMGSNGTLCYTYDGEIYTQKQGSKPQKVKIDIIRDDQHAIADLSFSSGATSATVSPDGKQVAFIVRGEVFVTSTDYSTTKQITHTPAREAGVTFSPDNRTLAYASERNGNWELCMAKIARKEEANFPNATTIEEEVLLPSDKIERTYPQFSPDGKELAFIEDRNRLMVLNLETQKVRQVTDGSTWFSTGGGFDYSWSPDGKWFTLEFIGNRHDPYSDIGMVSAQGGKVINLTNSGYTSGSPRWVLDGNAILFITERYGMRAHASWGSLNDVMLVFMNQDAYDKFRLSKEDYELQKELEKEQKSITETKKNDKKKGDNKNKSEEKKEEKTKDIIVELDNIEDRIVRTKSRGLHAAGTLHGQVTDVGHSLHQVVVGARAAVHFESLHGDAGVGLHGVQDIVDLIAQAVQRGADDVVFVATTGQAHDGAAGVLIPVGRAEAGEGGHDVAAVGVLDLLGHVLGVAGVFQQPQLVPQPLDRGTGHEDRTFQRIIYAAVAAARDGGDEAVLRDDRRFAGVHQKKAAGAEGVLRFAR